MAIQPDIRNGLNLADLDQLTQEEQNAYLLSAMRNRGPKYVLWCNELLSDFGRTHPDWLKVHARAVRQCDSGGHYEFSQPDSLIWSVHNLPSYMLIGWETGVTNEFFALWRLGLPLEQIMELVMFAQGYAGMRGLGHVYRAVGDFLPVYGPPKVPAAWPEGWAPDGEAFKSGLDLTVGDLTAEDRKNLEGWYEKNVGYVPKSIAFGIKHHPEFVKVNRAKWESAITTLPKQVAPYIMVKLNAQTQNVEGLRESALLAKSWGIEKKYVRQLLAGVACYFTGFEGYYAAAEAVDDLFDSWD